MAKDKYAAIRGKWRTSERYLLWQALLGGSIGILLATLPPLRHKKNDRKFKGVAFLYLLGQIIILLLLFHFMK